ncbi:hypothetical protein FAZ69_02770 [Trinickia terrae]|uniref:Uncharacterized protein n=1 Tax=Trinickia terrae TaxID=2571161 RepID=A0A4U1IFU6_9BURK|nr:hypothetical protein [Trinickia terrae]TKC92608.1 hypothetical protein FAZ69_02770 [Trinickia terrae]
MAASDTTTALHGACQVWHQQDGRHDCRHDVAAARHPVQRAPGGLSSSSIVTSQVMHTLGESVYEGTQAAVHNVINQVRASRRPRMELDPYGSKNQVHLKLMDETRDYVAR